MNGIILALEDAVEDVRVSAAAAVGYVAHGASTLFGTVGSDASSSARRVARRFVRLEPRARTDRDRPGTNVGSIAIARTPNGGSS